MGIHSLQRKAIYLSPNRLDLLHRRRGLADQQNGCMVCAVESGKVGWSGFADWLNARGFRVKKARPLYVTLPTPGIPCTRFAWLGSCGELDRLLELLEVRSGANQQNHEKPLEQNQLFGEDSNEIVTNHNLLLAFWEWRGCWGPPPLRH